MKIIIAGAGEVGTHLAKMLSKENQDITLIDNDQTKLDVIDSNYNLMTWNGSTSSFESLREVGVHDTDLYIAVTPFETRNLASCAIAKKMGAKKTVARIDNSEFLIPENRQLIRELGIDFVIYPEHLAANDIALSLTHNWARYWGELHNGELLLIGVKIHSNSVLLNVKLKDLPVTTHDFHIAAIKRNNETIIPNGNDEILPDDVVYFITTPPYIQQVRELCGKTKKVIKKALIMGGSRIAKRFATLYHDKFHIKILETDMSVCERLATELPDCEIVYGDGRDIEVLRENNIYQYDAFLALTESSETNILTCLTAKEFGVPKTIADVENLQFLGLAENLNIGNTINKKLLASSRIYKILLDADESNSRFFALADAEVAEIYVRKGAKITRSPVKDLNLPFGMTLAAMVRNNEVMLVNGNTHIVAGDYVVVFSLMGTIQKIEKWFN
ncbi:MAG: Trk system potassium transporter TrkA [Muribaculaceae bacterium]|nr:Trk system potassium transporter TrkA [Muribaculaceae bacterium]